MSSDFIHGLLKVLYLLVGRVIPDLILNFRVVWKANCLKNSDHTNVQLLRKNISPLSIWGIRPHFKLHMETFSLFFRQFYFLRPKKNYAFPEMRVTTKIFTWRPQIFFFKSVFRRCSLLFFCFFAGFFFAFFDSFFFCLFVWCFWKSKMYILIHIWLCERVSDKKKFHSANFQKQNSFFWPNINFLITKQNKTPGVDRKMMKQ